VQNIKEGIEGRPASWYKEIFDVVFPNLDKEEANTCKICEWKKKHGSSSSESDSKDD
jgi:Lon-like ATP-dependent protease